MLRTAPAVTDRVEAEAELRAAHERYTEATRAGGVAIYSLDLATGQVTADPVLNELLGYPPEQPVDHAEWIARIHAEDRPRIRAHEKLVLSDAAPRDAEGNTPLPALEYRVLAADGSYRWFLNRGRVIRDADGTPTRLVGTVREVTARREAQEALHRSHGQIRALAGRLLIAQEDERRRVARELHDDLNQRLAHIAITISNLRGGKRDAASIDSALGALQQDLNRLAAEIRALSHRMHPTVLEQAGLVAALRSLCLDMDADGDVQPRIRFEGPDDLVVTSPDAALCLYRVAQEALSNALKHAGAQRIDVTLSRADGTADLRIEDDGRGFDVRSAHPGLGLVSIRERVHLAGGRTVIASRPGEGTRIEVHVPVGERT